MSLADPNRPLAPASPSPVGVVVIGRNEAPRLRAAIESARPGAGYLLYVDSASIDDSRQIALDAGVAVVEIREGPFTAARARAVGLEALLSRAPGTRYVQFLDGDCALAEGWLVQATAFLDAHPEAAAVVGRLREARASSSVLLRLVAIDWDLPVGETDAIGGISMLRADALVRAGGWRSELIAGEELELSARLRAAGYKLHRLDGEMCSHDMGITRVREYWARCVRTGYSYAHLATLRISSAPRRWRRRALGNVFYGMALPMAIGAGAVLCWPLAAAGALVLASLVGRLALGRVRRRDPLHIAVAYGLLAALCKPAAAFGTARFVLDRALGRPSALIEYKASHHPAASAGEVQ